MFIWLREICNKRQSNGRFLRAKLKYNIISSLKQQIFKYLYDKTYGNRANDMSNFFYLDRASVEVLDENTQKQFTSDHKTQKATK